MWCCVRATFPSVCMDQAIATQGKHKFFNKITTTREGTIYQPIQCLDRLIETRVSINQNTNYTDKYFINRVETLSIVRLNLSWCYKRFVLVLPQLDSSIGRGFAHYAGYASSNSAQVNFSLTIKCWVVLIRSVVRIKIIFENIFNQNAIANIYSFETYWYPDFH